MLAAGRPDGLIDTRLDVLEVVAAVETIRSHLHMELATLHAMAHTAAAHQYRVQRSFALGSQMAVVILVDTVGILNHRERSVARESAIERHLKTLVVNSLGPVRLRGTSKRW